MLAGRASTILDIGCGHGSAVNGLRARGHAAFGIERHARGVGCGAR
nr:methionine biosynthesis protein MetW [Cryobacterium sp. Y50]